MTIGIEYKSGILSLRTCNIVTLDTHPIDASRIPQLPICLRRDDKKIAVQFSSYRNNEEADIVIVDGLVVVPELGGIDLCTVPSDRKIMTINTAGGITFRYQSRVNGFFSFDPLGNVVRNYEPGDLAIVSGGVVLRGK